MLDFFDTGNPFSYLSFNEEKGLAAVRDLRRLEGVQGRVTKRDIDKALSAHHVNYSDLPKYLIQEIDKFDI